MGATMKVDSTDSAQNAFVQEWLEAWRDKYIESKPVNAESVLDYDHIESTIELIQETYSFESLEITWYTLRRIHKLMGESNPDLAGQIELAAAFCKATAQYQGESWALRNPDETTATT
jgi:hypothetical protein